MSDFEPGFINAVNEMFPDAKSVGCFFHLSQNIMKHVQQDKVVYQRYREDEEFALQVSLLFSIQKLGLVIKSSMYIRSR